MVKQQMFVYYTNVVQMSSDYDWRIMATFVHTAS